MKIFFLILSLTSLLFSKAQTVTLLKGEAFEHFKKLYFSHPVERDDQAQYFFETTKFYYNDACLLYRIGINDGKLNWKQEVKFEKTMEFFAAYTKNERVLLFTKLKDRKADVMFLLLREFDSKTGVGIGIMKVVSQLSLKEETSFERNFFVAFSQDNKKCWLYRKSASIH